MVLPNVHLDVVGIDTRHLMDEDGVEPFDDDEIYGERYPDDASPPTNFCFTAATGYDQRLMLDAANGGITHYAPNRWDHGAGWIVTPRGEYAKPDLATGPMAIGTSRCAPERRACPGGSRNGGLCVRPAQRVQNGHGVRRRPAGRLGGERTAGCQQQVRRVAHRAARLELPCDAELFRQVADLFLVCDELTAEGSGIERPQTLCIHPTTVAIRLRRLRPF
jgi:hypothetical protein